MTKDYESNKVHFKALGWTYRYLPETRNIEYSKKSKKYETVVLAEVFDHAESSDKPKEHEFTEENKQKRVKYSTLNIWIKKKGKS